MIFSLAFSSFKIQNLATQLQIVDENQPIINKNK